jgi:hypothetical protein
MSLRIVCIILVMTSPFAVLAACDAGGAPPLKAEGLPRQPVAAAPSHSDSIFPMDEHIRRFRAGLRDQPATLVGGAASRAELVERFVRAVESHDTASLRTMVLSRAEFAYLYYPTSRSSRPPMQQSPALVWFQIQQNSEKGIVRALRRHGGRPLGYVTHECEPQPTREGENVLWEVCSLERVLPSGDRSSGRWFGSIIERNGHFKFISYANDL